MSNIYTFLYVDNDGTRCNYKQRFNNNEYYFKHDEEGKLAFFRAHKDGDYAIKFSEALKDIEPPEDDDGINLEVIERLLEKEEGGAIIIKDMKYNLNKLKDMDFSHAEVKADAAGGYLVLFYDGQFNIIAKTETIYTSMKQVAGHLLMTFNDMEIEGLEL